MRRSHWGGTSSNTGRQGPEREKRLQLLAAVGVPLDVHPARQARMIAATKPPKKEGVQMSHIVVMFATYLCSPAAGSCDIVFNEGEPASYEHEQDCVNFIKRIERPDAKGAWYECRKVDYDDSVGVSGLPEHLPLKSPKS
jgi:hypothetical protein